MGLTFLWTWTLRWVPRSFAIYASLCNTLPSNKLCPKSVKIPVVKWLNYQKVWKLWLFFTIVIFLFKLSKSNLKSKLKLFFTILIFLFNPLTTYDGLLRHENLTFLWTWTLRWVPRSFAIYASLCNTLPSNKLFTKTVKIPVVEGLNNHM